MKSLCVICHRPSHNYEKTKTQGEYICFDCKVKYGNKANRISGNKNIKAMNKNIKTIY